MQMHKALFLMLCAFPQFAYATSCLQQDPLKGRYGNADIVAIVSPIETQTYIFEDLPKLGSCVGCYVSEQQVKFSVKDPFVGSASGLVIPVIIAIDRDTTLDKDRDYFLAANLDQETNVYFTTMCQVDSFKPIDRNELNILRRGMDIRVRMDSVGKKN